MLDRPPNGDSRAVTAYPGHRRQNAQRIANCPQPNDEDTTCLRELRLRHKTEVRGAGYWLDRPFPVIAFKHMTLMAFW